MVQLGDNSWVGSLLCFADELVLGRARVEESGRLAVSSISREDHRKLPTAVLEELSVTVRSEAYRIQRSGKGAKADRGWLRADQNQPSDAPEHWLRVFYHVFEKFPVRSLIDSAMDPEPSCPLQIGVVFTDGQDEAFEADAARVCKAYFNNLMEDLRRLNKPLAGLDLASTLSCQGLAETRGFMKKSTGKSYFLNHLTGTTFAISGSRCTDGAWMSLRFLSTDTLLVVLDFEGLGSFERSEQEDIFLSVLNASVSMFTVFRMESRFDKDIDGLFSRFQKGVQLIKNDARLFRGLLFMSVKDVNMNDRQGVVDELATKLNAIFDSSREHNFLTEMYAGQVEINCTPPFGTREYYQSMENDAAKRLLEIVSPIEGAGGGFSTGKAFLDCLRIVLAKISILDWTSMDKSTQKLVVSNVKQKLPGILRTGCHVPQSLVAEPTISPQMKEVVLQVGSQKKVFVSFEEVCQRYPGNATKWKALNRVAALDEIADETIDFGFDVTAIEDRGIKTIQRILIALFHKLCVLGYKEKDCARFTTEDQKCFDDFVAFVLRRRKMKVSLWLRSALDDRLSETRSKLEQRYVDQLVIFLSRCQHRCASCQLGCTHSAAHSTEMQHHCGTNHKCRGRCEYAECRVGSESKAPPCSRSAGHEGKCECEKGEHTCGQLCVLARAFNCDRTCSKLAEHPGDHRCSVQVHTCGAPCSAETCKAACVLDIQRRHVVHKCVEMQCLHECCMHGCKHICGEKNHFHGQADESRAFAEENGMTYSPNLCEDSVDMEGSPVTHMCLASHACPELCQVSGMCEQKVHLKKSSRTYQGARGSFEYIYQEMNGCKKQCICVVPGGRHDHEPLEHSCVAPTENAIEFSSMQTIHYCDVRCPCCDYYCNKPFGHMGLHDTSHGNMQRTYFLAKSNDIDLEDRKYQVGERGVAEMCNLFCTKMGRGHIHYLPCEGKGREHCVYTADASKDRRRHCEDELYPPPGKAMDELLHCRFWTTIGWEDPCSEEERALFAKCPFQCDAPEHEEADKAPSYCTLEAWHLPEMKPEVGDGFAYIHGHKFECVHAVDSGKFHNIFVLDNSGSMSGRPWKNLLCACNEFGINRLQDGGEGDLVSYITFSNCSIIHCEGEPLEEALKMKLPYYGGGTSFEVGLRAANEVLSRNDHKHFKAVVIFFSDGHPRDINLALAIAQRMRSMYVKYDFKAFVVGFGHVNLPVLQRMAVEMGGEYRHVLDASELQKEFQRIGAVLRKSEASLALVEA
ncbi:hypothetical protein PF011_g20941 [Phytophthora fragariae]|uniref:VWFA domain-containing protein n=1 Tax=Phytophthora fragariae TaxID=53985 RepID=A0A6A3IT96_9STRA|nr:hypothetical protein PF011_g20941 [Phytophthora fragariae]